MAAKREIVENAISAYRHLFVDERISYAHRALGESKVRCDNFLNNFDATVDLAIISFVTDNAYEIANNIDTSMLLEQSMAHSNLATQNYAPQVQAYEFAQRIQENIESITQEDFLRRLEILSDPQKIQELKEKELRQLRIIATCMSNPVIGVAVALVYALELDKIHQNSTKIQNDENKTRSLLAILLGYDLSPIDEEWQQRKEAEAKKMAEFFQESLDRHKTEQAQYAQQRGDEGKNQKDADRLAQKDWDERNSPKPDSRHRPRL